jgi:2,5-dioxopentanoate dehydrogenase
MLKGFNAIGFDESKEGNKYLHAFSPVNQTDLPENFTVATTDEVNKAVAKAVIAFATYKSLPPEAKAVFLETIAEEIMLLGDALIERAMQETGLPEARLVGERARTTGQLKLFADLLREGSWVEAVIDEALPERKPLPRSDLRKMLVPVGPVVVFGASNFPFAFSTAGGDTASALASGCPVIVKAHASHLGTNELVATAIINAAKKCNMPDGVFSFIVGEGAVMGMQLVKHPGVKAVGFTGSYNAGMAIYKAAVNERETPIPVYAEMSSINPVVILPRQLSKDTDKTATQLAGSITLGVGQFCTNPGLLFLPDDDASATFIQQLKEKLAALPAGTMLNKNICNSYYKNRQNIAMQSGVTTLFAGDTVINDVKGSPALMEVTAADFIANPQLQNEMFGPASLIIKCKDQTELQQALQSLHGQLTGTVIADINDLQNFSTCIETLTSKVGRLIYNGVPTGVEVCHAMVHGGPFPATSDARSTSVGADAIKRFVRPLCWQDCPHEFLPDALKDKNPLNIMRKINGGYTRDKLGN